MGYANRTIYLGFGDLTEDGEPEVHLIIKNPKIVPLDELQPADLKIGPNGQVDEGAAKLAMYKVVSSITVAGRVFDATCFDDEEQQPMRLPLTPDDVARLPWEIVRQVTARIEEVMNPPS